MRFLSHSPFQSMSGWVPSPFFSAMKSVQTSLPYTTTGRLQLLLLLYCPKWRNKQLTFLAPNFLYSHYLFFVLCDVNQYSTPCAARLHCEPSLVRCWPVSIVRKWDGVSRKNVATWILESSILVGNANKELRTKKNTQLINQYRCRRAERMLLQDGTCASQW